MVIFGLVMLLFWVFIGLLMGLFGVHNGNVLSNGLAVDCKGVISGSLMGNILSGICLWFHCGFVVGNHWFRCGHLFYEVVVLWSYRGLVRGNGSLLFLRKKIWHCYRRCFSAAVPYVLSMLSKHFFVSVSFPGVRNPCPYGSRCSVKCGC